MTVQHRAQRTVLRLNGPIVRRSAVALALVVLATALSWWRLGVVTRNTVWAEDAGRFLRDHLDATGLPPLLLPYDGYLHLVPRALVAIAADTVPLDRYGVAVAGMSCVVIGVVCAGVYLLAVDLVSVAPVRALVAIVPAIVPMAPVEILGNTANLRWYLLFLAPFLFAAVPRTVWSSSALAVAALLVTLTEIQSALFLPLLLVGVRRRAKLPLVAAAALGVAAQVATAVTEPRDGDGGATPRLADLLLGWLAQTVAGSWDADVVRTGAAVVTNGWWVVAVPALLVAMLVIAAVAFAPTRTRWVLLALAGASVVVWFAALWVNPTSAQNWIGWGPEIGPTRPLRYAAATSMFLVAAALVSVDALLAPTWRRGRGGVARPRDSSGQGGVAPYRGSRPRADRVGPLAWAIARRGIAAVVVGVVLVGSASSVSPRETRRSAGPSWQDEVQRARAACAADASGNARLGAAPSGDLWFVVVPCSRVLDDR